MTPFNRPMADRHDDFYSVRQERILSQPARLISLSTLMLSSFLDQPSKLLVDEDTFTFAEAFEGGTDRGSEKGAAGTGFLLGFWKKRLSLSWTMRPKTIFTLATSVVQCTHYRD